MTTNASIPPGPDAEREGTTMFKAKHEVDRRTTFDQNHYLMRALLNVR